MTHIIPLKKPAFLLLLYCFTLTFDLYEAVRTGFLDGSNDAEMFAKVDETNATVQTFQVKAVDNAEHVDPTPASQTRNSDKQPQSAVYLNRGSGGHSGSHSSHSSHSEGSHSEGAGASGGPASSGAVSLKFTRIGLYSLWPLWATLMWYLL